MDASVTAIVATKGTAWIHRGEPVPRTEAWEQRVLEAGERTRACGSYLASRDSSDVPIALHPKRTFRVGNPTCVVYKMPPWNSHAGFVALADKLEV